MIADCDGGLALRDLLDKQCRKVDFPDPFVAALFCCEGLSRGNDPLARQLKLSPLDGSGHKYGSFPRVYVTYLIRRMMGIHRLPGFEERSCDAFERDNLTARLRSMASADIERHLNALQQLYDHTQAELSRVLDGATTIRLYRGFKREQHLAMSVAVRRAQELKLDQVPIFFNTFDFFSVKHGGHSDGSYIVMNVPVRDVVLCHHTVHGFHGTDADVFVACRSETGMVEVPLSCLHATKPPEEAYEFYRRVESNSFNYAVIFENLMQDLFFRQKGRRMNRREGQFERFLASVGRQIDGWRSPERYHLEWE